MTNKPTAGAGVANWKNRANSLIPALGDVHRGWLPDVLQRNAPLLEAALAKPVAARLLRRMLPLDNRPAATAAVALPAWTRCDRSGLRALTRQLGALACAAQIRQTITKPELAQVFVAIPEEVHEQVVVCNQTLLTGNAADKLTGQYNTALANKTLNTFLAALGLSLLLTTLPDQQSTPLRLRYLIAPQVWSAVTARISHDAAVLQNLLETAVNNTAAEES